MKKLAIAILSVFLFACAGPKVIPTTYNERLVTAQKQAEKVTDGLTERALFGAFTPTQKKKILSLAERIDDALDIAEAASMSGDLENSAGYINIAEGLLLELEKELAKEVQK